jgi:hypothetical protein
VASGTRRSLDWAFRDFVGTPAAARIAAATEYSRIRLHAGADSPTHPAVFDSQTRPITAGAKQETTLPGVDQIFAVDEIKGLK